jgi:ATP-dependent Lon protease
MTGAIDQKGNILAIGGVNEKIEGFFDICNDVGLTGTQGVLIPAANAAEMMLREDVVDACREGRFHVYAADRVHEALDLFTGMPAGERDEEDAYPEDTLLALALERAHEYWLKAKGAHALLLGEEEEEEEEEEERVDQAAEESE